MPTLLPPLSPELPRVYRLDKAETALEDLTAFNKEYISLVLIGTPDKKDLILKLLNAFCSEPTADPRLRAIWIEEGEILDLLLPSLTSMLSAAFPTEPVDGIQAFTTIAASDVPFEFLRKGPFTFNGLTIKQAINRAVIHSPASETT